ncbi:MAG: hypothetical protein KW804_01600 [Candidatus Doudnabacteria bacterium]|nr:hypothetical protein [Candidatus Doudnabacteria bacterium]
MKKLLVLAGAVVFLAAACNQSQNTVVTPPTHATASSKVDAAVSGLDKNVDTEDGIYMQSDSDIVNSDQDVINGYNGVSNASKY